MRRSTGGLHAIVSYRGEHRRGVAPPYELSVGGPKGRTETLLHWAVPELKVGDEVIIRIHEAGEGDAPHERVRYDPEVMLRQEQEYVRQMAQEWGWEIRELPVLE